MLSITYQDKQGRLRTHSWWVGNPLPVIPARHVTFHADGKELEMLMKGLKNDKIQDKHDWEL